MTDTSWNLQKTAERKARRFTTDTGAFMLNGMDHKPSVLVVAESGLRPELALDAFCDTTEAIPDGGKRGLDGSLTEPGSGLRPYICTDVGDGSELIAQCWLFAHLESAHHVAPPNSLASGSAFHRSMTLGRRRDGTRPSPTEVQLIASGNQRAHSRRAKSARDATHHLARLARSAAIPDTAKEGAGQ